MSDFQAFLLNFCYRFVSSFTQHVQVDSYTKALQTMATVCSCLKYYGYVVIGVARDEDRILVNDMVRYLHFRTLLGFVGAQCHSVRFVPHFTFSSTFIS